MGRIYQILELEQENQCLRKIIQELTDILERYAVDEDAKVVLEKAKEIIAN